MRRFEQAIRVVTAFYAVLLGFGLKNLLDHGVEGAKHSCLVLSTLLFLRFLLGSANHMWYVYVRDDLDPGRSEFPSRRWPMMFDCCFLILFGFLALDICYSTTVPKFLFLHLFLPVLAHIWAFCYMVHREWWKNEKTPDVWDYWFWLNAVQAFCIAFAIFAGLDWGWNWTLVLVSLIFAYLALLGWDFYKQLEILEALRPQGKTNREAN